MSEVSWRIVEGDAVSSLASIPAGSVQTCITSPPYFGLRDYGEDGQIGLEATPDAYVARLVEVFREVRDALRGDGTLWLNLGDSYAQYDGQGNLGEPREPGQHGAFRVSPNLSTVAENRGPARHSLPPGSKRKDLLGIPWRVAFALQADGWYLRSDIIWSKPNPMPESVTDRPTKAHEYLFLFAKSPRYFYDADAIREESAPSALARAGLRKMPSPKERQREAAGFQPGLSGDYGAGRNRQSVWTVATQPFREAHFATFPPKLIEPCVLAGSSHRACSECGAPWARQVEHDANGKPRSALESHNAGTGLAPHSGYRGTPTVKTLGFKPSCAHDDGDGTSVVLDPFAGAGTTGMVALRHDRSFVGVELNPTYAEMARQRIRDDGPLFNVASEQVSAP